MGSHVARWLQEDGWEVHVLVRPGSDPALLRAQARGVVLHEHDGTASGALTIVQAADPDVVLHIAALSGSPEDQRDVTELMRSNVLFGTHLLEAMADHGVRDLVNTSTYWQHYEGRGYNPVNLYAATKQAFETIIEHYVQSCSLRAISLVLFDTYGPGDPRPRLLPTLVEALREGRPPLAVSPGEQLLDLVHIDDVGRAYVVAARLLLEGRCCSHSRYAVSSGGTFSLRELADHLGHVAGVQPQVSWGARPYRPREVMVPWTGGLPPPGWAPRVGLDEGLRQLVESGNQPVSART